MLVFGEDSLLGLFAVKLCLKLKIRCMPAMFFILRWIFVRTLQEITIKPAAGSSIENKGRYSYVPQMAH